MARIKGSPRTGGRLKGTPNKKTQVLLEICEQEGLDPFRALVKLANPYKEDMSVEQRLAAAAMQFSALKEICQYLYPKRKAMELSGDVGLRVILEDYSSNSGE